MFRDHTPPFPLFNLMSPYPFLLIFFKNTDKRFIFALIESRNIGKLPGIFHLLPHFQVY